ncbi:MAG: polysaccharide deacetylase family protein [Phycisphaerae bacterium]
MRFIIAAFATIMLAGCGGSFCEKYAGAEPKLWGETLPGIERYLDYGADEKKICLTLDACGSKGDGFDKDIIEFLEYEKMPATLFINSRWIEKNPEQFERLAANPIFDIQNHGTRHLPASVDGKSIYGLAGTANACELVEEVSGCDAMIEELTGKKPTFFRSAAAFYDEYAVEVIGRLGYKIAGFSVLGDAGTTYNREQVYDTVRQAQANDIIIAHMNHPERETAEGLIPALIELKAMGYKMVALSESPTTHSAPTGYTPAERNLSIDMNSRK